MRVVGPDYDCVSLGGREVGALAVPANAAPSGQPVQDSTSLIPQIYREQKHPDSSRWADCCSSFTEQTDKVSA